MKGSQSDIWELSVAERGEAEGFNATDLLHCAVMLARPDLFGKIKRHRVAPSQTVTFHLL